MHKPVRLVAVPVLAATLLFGCSSGGGKDPIARKTTTTSVKVEKTTTTADVPDETTTTAAGSDLDEWASGFCTAFEDDWLGAITDASTNVNSSGATDVASIRASLVEMFGAASDATGTLITEVTDLGAPDTENGEEIHAALIERFTQFKSTADKAAADIAALPDDPASFRDGAYDLLNEFQTSATKVGDSFKEIDAQYPSPELAQHLSSACSSF
jgi:hypothetical protein